MAVKTNSTHDQLIVMTRAYIERTKQLKEERNLFNDPLKLEEEIVKTEAYLQGLRGEEPNNEHA